MQVIAITGAGSFIGTHLVKHLSMTDDLNLRLLVHRNTNIPLPEGANISVIQGDLLQPETMDNFAEAGCTVVHLAYLNRHNAADNFAAAANLAEICRKTGVRRLVHCSTAVVSGRVVADNVTEDTVPNPLTEYEIVKAKVENILLEKASGLFETVILRPTAVFGRGGKNLLKLAGDLCNGNRTLNYLKSCLFQNRRMNLVCVDNVVSAIAFLIRTDRKVDREIFIISDDEAMANNYRDVERYLMKRLGCKEYPIRPIQLPFVILKILLRLIGRTNTNPFLVYDCGKILSAGFNKPVSFEEALSQFADWYVESYYSETRMGSS